MRAHSFLFFVTPRYMMMKDAPLVVVPIKLVAVGRAEAVVV